MEWPNLKLALVHDWLTGMRGGEKCLEVICRRFPRATLYTLLHAKGSTAPAIEAMRVQASFLQRLPGAARYYRQLLPLMPLAIETLTIAGRFDLVLSFSHAVAKSVRVPSGTPHVCYCFTPMRYAWQLRDHYFAGRPGDGRRLLLAQIGRGLAASRSALLDLLQTWDYRTAMRVTRFIACSRTTAQRIRQCYGRESQIIYPPVDTDFYTPARLHREPWYLCVSALVPYKRIDLAIAACRQLGRRLVVIGQGPQRTRLERLAGGNVRFLGWQSNEVIRDHLRRCRALVFPGLEDFGIVPLEAQACGAPVIAYGQGGATETVVPPAPDAPGTGLLFKPQTVDALCAAMLDLERAPDRLCGELARANAERFQVWRYEREMLACLSEVAVGTFNDRRPARARRCAIPPRSE